MNDRLELVIPISQEELDKIEVLAQRRGLTDLAAYVRELMDADSRAQENDLLVSQLRSARLLVENWDEVDHEIAELAAQGVTPLHESVKLPPNARSSEQLLDEERGED